MLSDQVLLLLLEHDLPDLVLYLVQGCAAAGVFVVLVELGDLRVVDFHVGDQRREVLLNQLTLIGRRCILLFRRLYLGQGDQELTCRQVLQHKESVLLELGLDLLGGFGDLIGDVFIADGQTLRPQEHSDRQIRQSRISQTVRGQARIGLVHQSGFLGHLGFRRGRFSRADGKGR